MVLYLLGPTILSKNLLKAKDCLPRKKIILWQPWQLNMIWPYRVASHVTLLLLSAAIACHHAELQWGTFFFKQHWYCMQHDVTSRENKCWIGGAQLCFLCQRAFQSTVNDLCQFLLTFTSDIYQWHLQERLIGRVQWYCQSLFMQTEELMFGSCPT